MEINQIYEADSLDLMKRMPAAFIDRVITSPPYNINRGYIEYDDKISADNYIKWQVDFFNEFNRVLKPNGLVIWNLSYGVENPILPFKVISNIDENTNWTVVDTIIWKKRNATPIYSNRLTRITEYIFVFARKNEVDSFERNKEFSRQGNLGFKYHQTYIEAPNNDGLEVPLNKAVFSTELVLKILSVYCDHNHLVYEPFCGIGTCIRACMIYGCNFLGSELSWRQVNYFNNKRLPAIKRKIKKLRDYYADLNIEFAES